MPVEDRRLCPDCHVVIRDAANFCENCGYPINPAPAEVTSRSGRVEETLVGKASVGICSSCGYQNLSGEMFCQNCGVQLAPVTSSPPPRPINVSNGLGMSETKPSETVIGLVGGSGNVVIALEMDRDEWLVGRSDPVRGIFPEVDLAAHGGDEGGVSRRHARLFRQKGQCFISDLNSTNSTFLNGEKLQPGGLYSIKHGDKIRFGLLAMTFFEEFAK